MINDNDSPRNRTVGNGYVSPVPQTPATVPSVRVKFNRPSVRVRFKHKVK